MAADASPTSPDPQGTGRTAAPRRRPLRPATLAAIAVGGMLGTPARVELGRLLPAGPAFPWGTFVVNIAGSILLGAGAALILERRGPSRLLWPAFATGLCGSFTTFSTFAVEIDLRLQAGAVASGLGYAAASLVLGLLALNVGLGVGRAVGRRRTGGGGREGRW